MVPESWRSRWTPMPESRQVRLLPAIPQYWTVDPSDDAGSVRRPQTGSPAQTPPPAVAEVGPANLAFFVGTIIFAIPLLRGSKRLRWPVALIAIGVLFVLVEILTVHFSLRSAALVSFSSRAAGPPVALSPESRSSSAACPRRRRGLEGRRTHKNAASGFGVRSILITHRFDINHRARSRRRTGTWHTHAFRSGGT
jgi:hypothetical protein